MDENEDDNGTILKREKKSYRKGYRDTEKGMSEGGGRGWWEVEGMK